MVQRIVVSTTSGNGELFIARTPCDDTDTAHPPTRIHIRRADDSIQRNVGWECVREGRCVFPVFHITGAVYDSSDESFVPHIIVSDLIVLEKTGDGEEGVDREVCMPTL